MSSNTNIEKENRAYFSDRVYNVEYKKIFTETIYNPIKNKTYVYSKDLVTRIKNKEEHQYSRIFENRMPKTIDEYKKIEHKIPEEYKRNFQNKYIYEGKLILAPDGNEYRVIDVEDNISNGMQGMAVAKVINGKADYSQITIAYAGTNIEDFKDINIDLDVANKNYNNRKYLNDENSQINAAIRFSENIKSKYPNAELDITGHSLAGAIAFKVALYLQVKGTVFQPIRLDAFLTEEERAYYLENKEKYSINRIEEDWIINMFGGIGLEKQEFDIAYQNNKVDGLLGGHTLKGNYYKEFSEKITDRTRDFSDEVKQKLLALVSEVDPEFIFDIAHWDIFYRIERLFSNGVQIEKNAKAINDYYRKTIDIDGVTRSQIEKVFHEVNEIDDRYAKEYVQVEEALQRIIREFQKISESIKV